VTVLNNPGKFTDPYLFKITFECMAPLQDGPSSSSLCRRLVPPRQRLTLPPRPLLTTADLEWKLTYVGSAESDSFDQELDTCMVGPVPVGVNSFEFEVSSTSVMLCARRERGTSQADWAARTQAAAPLPSRIPASDLIGVTVILLTCSYNDAEFVRIGYYVNTEYGDPALKQQHDAALAEGADEQGLKAPDPTQHIDGLVREVLADKPRVTKFNIQWCVAIPCTACPPCNGSGEAD